MNQNNMGIKNMDSILDEISKCNVCSNPSNVDYYKDVVKGLADKQCQCIHSDKPRQSGIIETEQNNDEDNLITYKDSLFAKDNLDNIKNKEKINPLYPCQKCSKIFSRPFDLKTHLNLHLGIKLHMCHICGQSFSHRSNLNRHIRVHSMVKPYICKICKKRFIQLHTLNLHKRIHKDGHLQCPFCEIQIIKWLPMKKHMLRIHKRVISLMEFNKIYQRRDKNLSNKVKRSFHCQVCGDTFCLKSDLKKHEKEIHGKLAIHCTGCSQVYNLLEDFKKHSCILQDNQTNNRLDDSIDNSIVPQDDEVNCEEMYVVYTSQDGEQIFGIIENILPQNNLETLCISNADCVQFISVQNDEKGNCIAKLNNCEPPAITDSSIFCLDEPIEINEFNEQSKCNILQQAIMEASIISPTDEISTDMIENLGEFPSTDLSSKEFPLEERSMEIKDEYIRIKELKENKAIGSDELLAKEFSCEICGKSFKRKWNMQQHIGVHDANLQQYKCKDCKQTFSYRSTYERHLKLHLELEQESYPCRLCSKVYKSNNALSQHVKKIHENRLNYTCELCGKSFFNKSSHSHHMRVHSEKRPHICSFCGKSFSHSSHLYRHERKHIDDHPHKCLHCSKKFIQAYSLQMHLREKHG